MTSTRRVSSSVTSISWIPSEAVTGLATRLMDSGLSHYDAPPPDRFDSLELLRDADRFRFANRLAAWAEFEGHRPLRFGTTGGGVMGSSTARVGPFGMTLRGVALPDLAPTPEVGDGWVRFQQTTGGRTGFPLPRRIPTPPFLRVQAPLVWTSLSLTLRADGSAEGAIVGASPFPRHWVYDADNRLVRKVAAASWADWLDQASWRKTPWGDQDSSIVVTDAESEAERALSPLIMHGAAAPVIRILPAGAVLMKQGTPGDSVALLLDGVVELDVDGRQLASLGPGAILGERSALSNGLRSATLTASTAIRVAEVAASSLDRAALDAVAGEHHREDGRGQVDERHRHHGEDSWS